MINNVTKPSLQLSSYGNCSCTISGEASLGQCGEPCRVKMFISLLITTVGVVISFSGYAAHAYIYNRIVREVDRTFTQGVRSSLVRALGTLPSPLIFGWVIWPSFRARRSILNPLRTI